MEIRRLDRRKCSELWGDGRRHPIPDLQELTADEARIREKCLEAFSRYSELAGYKLDAAFAADMYFEILRFESGFTLRLAADDRVWRRLSVQVLPDFVAQRWGIGDDGAFPRDHFWFKPQRIWLKCLWWYCHLARQTDKDSTVEVLNRGSTDAIQAIVERPGSGGFRVDLSREIMKRLADKDFSVETLKRIMKLNTAKACLIEPAFFAGGLVGYVDSLIEDLLCERAR
jgi:hypothetical protein